MPIGFPSYLCHDDIATFRFSLRLYSFLYFHTLGIRLFIRLDADADVDVCVYTYPGGCYVDCIRMDFGSRFMFESRNSFARNNVICSSEKISHRPLRFFRLRVAPRKEEITYSRYTDILSTSFLRSHTFRLHKNTRTNLQTTFIFVFKFDIPFVVYDQMLSVSARIFSERNLEEWNCPSAFLSRE